MCSECLKSLHCVGCHPNGGCRNRRNREAERSPRADAVCNGVQERAYHCMGSNPMDEDRYRQQNYISSARRQCVLSADRAWPLGALRCPWMQMGTGNKSIDPDSGWDSNVQAELRAILCGPFIPLMKMGGRKRGAQGKSWGTMLDSSI